MKFKTGQIDVLSTVQNKFSFYEKSGTNKVGINPILMSNYSDTSQHA